MSDEDDEKEKVTRTTLVVTALQVGLLIFFLPFFGLFHFAPGLGKFNILTISIASGVIAVAFLALTKKGRRLLDKLAELFDWLWGLWH